MARFEDQFPPYHPFGSRNLSQQSPQLHGTDVAVLQSIYDLMLEVMNPPQGPMGQPIAIDGVFGPKTRQAVVNVQSYFGLSVDGIAGPQTFLAFGQGVRGNVTYGGPAYGSRTLTQGNTGGDVTVLQNRLNTFRYASIIGHPATGTFDGATAAAVVAFKADAVANGQTGLANNAVVGSGTFDATWIYTFAGGRNLQTGSAGFDVAFVQLVLSQSTLGPGSPFYTGRITGYFDAATATAVRAFQTAKGLPADGVVGPSTYFQIGLANNHPAPVPMPVLQF